LVGLQTQEEVIDVQTVKVSTNVDELNAKVQSAPVIETEPDDLF